MIKKASMLIVSLGITTLTLAIPKINPHLDKLSAIEKHVRQFTDINRNNETYFFPYTVTNGLSELRANYAAMKGAIINRFNANHLGNKIPGSTTLYTHQQVAPSLHLGTTCIWNDAGEFDETCWQMLVDYVRANEPTPERQNRLYQTTLQKYLTVRAEVDPEEQHTGRNTNHILTSKYVQVAAASKGWDEVYELFTCGWTWSEELKDYEPYLTFEVTRKFFENPTALYEMNKSYQLPVPKPVDHSK